MNNAIKLLLVSSLLFFHVLGHSQNIKEVSSSRHEQWNASKALKAQFIKKQNVNYLVVRDADNNLVAEQLIPRAKKLANINWSSNDQYLTYTKNDSSLWLFNIKANSLTLIEHYFRLSAPRKFNVKWSPNGQWMHYLSSDNADYMTKVYSLKRKRSYVVPVSSEQIADIAWRGSDNKLVINTMQPTKQLTEISLYDMKIIVQPDEQIVKLN